MKKYSSPSPPEALQFRDGRDIFPPRILPMSSAFFLQDPLLPEPFPKEILREDLRDFFSIPFLFFLSYFREKGCLSDCGEDFLDFS